MLIPARLRAVNHEPSIASLLRQVVDDTGQLARAEMKLARAELTANVQKLIRPVAMIGAGALLGIAALFTLMGALVGFLTPYVGAGWAALIVAIVVGGTAVALMMAGANRFGAIAMQPKTALASVKADVAAVREASQ